MWDSAAEGGPTRRAMGAAGVVIRGTGRVFTQDQDPSQGETGMVVPQTEPELMAILSG